MTTKLERAAMQQALNLLESEWPEGDEIAQPVIDALREALAEQAEQEPVACPHGVDDGACKECYMEQTSDQYNGDDGTGFDEEFHAKLLAGAHLLDDEGRDLFNMGWEAAKAFMEERAAAEQAEQEPLLKHRTGDCLMCGHCSVTGEPLYAAPVQQVDLSDDEIEALFPKPWIELMTIKEFVRAVIAADRRKNNANNNT